MNLRIYGLIVGVIVALAPANSPAGEMRAKSILLDQFDMRGAAFDLMAPVFNWRQMQRWDIAASNLPPDGQIRFRSPPLWERYWLQSLAVIAIILIQAGLISILLHERRKRNDAEAEARSRLSQLAHFGRQATAGELSSSIAHELNQPLGAILTNAETAELILKSRSPDMTELAEIVADIRRDDLRASKIIQRMRSFLKRTPFELKDVDLNDVIGEAFEFLAVEAASRNVALCFKAFPKALPIKADSVQLQQVVMNLVVNSMEAVSAMPFGRAVIGRTELNGGSSAIVSISDSGPGIPSEKLAEIFDPFFTTKELGLGIGLSIARTIVHAHEGRIWAENLAEGGAVFRLSLPLICH
jgi:C4-dicarboxylate-specific signal transduction histidine kinase